MRERTVWHVRAAWILVGLAGAAFADETETKSTDPPPDSAAVMAGHSSRGEVFNEGPRQKAYLMTGTGKVDFPVTAKNPQVQAFVNQGVGQLHGFWYLEAERSFRQAAALEPECAMTYWGMAMANVENEKRAKGFIAEAVKRKQGLSEREVLYIDALNAYLTADSNKKKERGQNYMKALERILYKFPNDLEAKAWLCLQIWTNRQNDVSIGSPLAVDALLQQVLDVEPLHPCHHYRIHLWDYERPETALSSAARCGQSAPAIAHMWHMPGHIYSRLKRYDDAVWQQEASARVDHAHMIRDHILPDRIHNFAHNSEWLIRNLLHIGRVHDAIDLAKNMIELPRHPKYNTIGKRGSTYYGRLRLFGVLSEYELWSQLIQLAETVYLEPTDDFDEQIQRRACLGRANFRSGDANSGRAQLVFVDGLLKEQQAAQTQAVADVEAKTKQENKDEKAVCKAKDDAKKPFAAKIKTLQTAADELAGLAAVAAADYPKALELLKKAGGVDPMYLSRVTLLAGDEEQAQKIARDHVGSHPNEVRELAHLIHLLWQCDKKTEASDRFRDLRAMSASLNLDAPAFQALAPIAAELQFPEDWRIPAEAKSDVGERPALDSLGPFRWSPSPAPSWTLEDAENNDVTLDKFRGTPVVVICYLGYGCLHCVEQLQAFAPKTAAFADAGVSLIAISSDAQADLRKAVANYKDGQEAFPFPLVTDSELNVFKAYRAYDDFENRPLHATFLIDATGLVRWQDISYEPFKDADFLLAEAKRLLAQQPVTATSRE